METSPNQTTQPFKEPERTLFAHIDETLAAYDHYVLDHRLALEGIADEVAQNRYDQNGDEIVVDTNPL